MHKSTKITPVLRKEIFTRWKADAVSQRELAREYHVDKRVIGRIIERGKIGDFDIHSSVNKRFMPKTKKRTTARTAKPARARSAVKRSPSATTRRSVRKRT